MGGFGSGERVNKKTTVERCLKLDAGRFSKQAEIKLELHSYGEITWTNSNQERILSVRYWLEPRARNVAILHITSRLGADGTETALLEPILLTGTRPNLGGIRWWFICPLIAAGVKCNRRVKKLFLPPGGQYFGCRHCYKLTYESAQTHDHRVNKLMKDPFALIQEIESEDPMQKLRALQAYAKLQGWI